MLCYRQESDRLKRLAEQNSEQSWADYGTCRSQHTELMQFVAGYTYSVGCIREQDAKRITRAYPTPMTQLYFEFCGNLSAAHKPDGPVTISGRTDDTGSIDKRTYIKTGLGEWFDIWQTESPQAERPVKNLKIDLHPHTLYHLFQLSPIELHLEDLHLADLLGANTASLMQEEMEAVVSGPQLVEVAERYLLEQYYRIQSKCTKKPVISDFLPQLNQSLSQQADYYQKSERWLQKHYRQACGMTFKQMQTNLKFQRVLDLFQHSIRQKHPINLTEIAYHCGYFDQAHFIKAFRHFSGMTPGQYLKQLAGSDNLLFYW